MVMRARRGVGEVEKVREMVALGRERRGESGRGRGERREVRNDIVEVLLWVVIWYWVWESWGRG